MFSNIEERRPFPFSRIISHKIFEQPHNCIPKIYFLINTTERSPKARSIFLTRYLSVMTTNIIEQTGKTGETLQCTGYSECNLKKVKRITPVSPFSEDRKLITLTSS